MEELLLKYDGGYMIDLAVARCGQWLMIALVLAGEVSAQSFSAPVMRPIEYGYPDQSIFVATVDANGQVDSPMNRLAVVLMARLGLPLKAAFEMLKAGRADYVLDYASAARDILAESPIHALRAYKLDRLDIFLVLARSYPNAEELMRRMEAEVQTLDVTGLIQGRGGARTATAP